MSRKIKIFGTDFLIADILIWVAILFLVVLGLSQYSPDREEAVFQEPVKQGTSKKTYGEMLAEPLSSEEGDTPIYYDERDRINTDDFVGQMDIKLERKIPLLMD